MDKLFKQVVGWVVYADAIGCSLAAIFNLDLGYTDLDEVDFDVAMTIIKDCNKEELQEALDYFESGAYKDLADTTDCC